YRQRLQTENIRLREALTIYKVSEAIALSHDIDHILDVVLRAALDEVKADVATLHLRDPRSGAYEERVKIIAADDAPKGGLPSLELGVVLDQFTQGVPILAHGGRASRFFTENAQATELSSFVAVPLQVRASFVGVLNVFSFTPGKKFDEGH